MAKSKTPKVSSNNVASVRGNFKSGRVWKIPKQRFSSIKKTRGTKIANAFDKQMKRRDDLKRIQTITKTRNLDRSQMLEEKKQRRRDNLEKQKQNQLKSEIVQSISSAKLKRMKKKQLRTIEKRDTTQVVK